MLRGGISGSRVLNIIILPIGNDDDVRADEFALLVLKEDSMNHLGRFSANFSLSPSQLVRTMFLI